MTNEICANKLHHLKRSEAMGGNGGQTNYGLVIIKCRILSIDSLSCSEV